jgi:hypothetical protein
MLAVTLETEMEMFRGKYRHNGVAYIFSAGFDNKGFRLFREDLRV